MKKIALLLSCCAVLQVSAQVIDTTTASLPMFEDVDDKPVKRYATNKVLYTTPNRFISIGYEYQGSHTIGSPQFVQGDRRFEAAQGLRASINAPIISGTKGILSLGAFYWRTAYGGTSFPDALYSPLVRKGLHSAGLNLTLFKPFNETNFLIVQGGADANFLLDDGARFARRAITISGSAIYGWKRSESLMWGLGVSRTYRMGRLIHVPVLLYNRTFNEKWGVELLLPARGLVRHNFNPKTLATLGFELEGNQYALLSPNTRQRFFLQRGEIKPRINFERNLFGFWWLAVQAGMRVNGRFVVVNQYNGGKDREVVTTALGNPFYFNVSLNLVSL
jgi:hypothetical protein